MAIRLMRQATARRFELIDAVALCAAGCCTSVMLGLTLLLAG